MVSFFPLFANKYTYTQEVDRYSITSYICEYTEPCVHCCNFLVTELLHTAAVIFSHEKMNEIELVIETIDAKTRQMLKQISFPISYDLLFEISYDKV